MTTHIALWMAAALAASPEGVVAGRLAIFEGTQAVTLKQVRGALRESVGLNLRQGMEVFGARIDEDGYFVARAPPGRYRLEYVQVGDRAEMIRPQEVEIREGTLLCAGTLALTVSRMEALGVNSGSKVSASDDCAQSLPRLRRLAGWSGPEAVRLPSPVPLEEDSHRSLVSLLLGLRAEGSGGGAGNDTLALRGWYVLPITEYIGDHGSIMLDVSGARIAGGPVGLGTELAAGAGINLIGLLELHAMAGFQLSLNGGSSGPVLAGVARLGIVAGGLNVRAQLAPSTGMAIFVGLDVAPFFIVGSLL